MSFSYDRYDRRQPAPRQGRSTLGYWVPLILTVTVATAGLAAWVWSEREDSTDADDDADLSYGEERDTKDYAAGAATREHGSASASHADEGLVSRVQHVIRRTPSPQQLFDTVSKKTVAGVTAAGAAAGAMLASIREEDKDAFDDHSRWSEEAALRPHVEAQSAQSAAAVDTQARAFAESARSAAATGRRRKTVAVVVSAEALNGHGHDNNDGEYRSETATILSLLPPTDFAKTKLFVLIYAPSLHTSTSTPGPPSLTSSYSAISTPAATTPGEDLRSIDPQPFDASFASTSGTSLYSTLHAQAARLVENPAMIMPFSTPTGHIHMLRHIAPDLVYIVDALSGAQGHNVEDLKRWVGQTVVVVDSDGTGLGALVDTDDEGASASGKGKGRAGEHGHLHEGKWWESSDLVGLGKGVEIVDASRFGEDFERRAGGRE